MYNKHMSIITKHWTKILYLSEKYAGTDILYLTKSSFWFILGKGAILFIYFLLMVAFANLLPKETYGIYQYLISFVGLFGIFALPGINIALIKSIVQGNDNSLLLALKTKLTWSLLGSFGMFLGTIWYLYNGETTLAIAFFIGGIFLPLYTSFPIFEAYWNAKKNFKQKSKYEVLAAFLSSIGIILVLYLSNNIITILFVFFGSYVLFQGFFLWRTIQQLKNGGEDLSFIKFGKHLSIITAISIFAEHIDKILLWKFLGPMQLAIYSFAIIPLQKIMSLNPMGPLALPKLNENFNTDIRQNLIKKFLKSFILTIPVSIILILLAPFIYQTFLPQYQESVIYFKILSILIAFLPFALLRIMFVVKTYRKELYIISIIRSLSKIILYLILIPYFGILGAVLGNIIGEIIGNSVLLYLFLKPISKKDFNLNDA